MIRLMRRALFLFLAAATFGLAACANSLKSNESLNSADDTAPLDATIGDIAPGIWIGFGVCGGTDVTFSLAIRVDDVLQGGFIAEAGGGLAPITLAGRPVGVGEQTMLLRAKAWRMEDLSRQTSQFDLELTYLPLPEMLVINRIGVETECRNLVARKIQQTYLPSNPEGLLFKAVASSSDRAIQQTMAALTDEDCATYVIWVTEGRSKLVTSKAAQQVHPAIYDPEGMVRVLGRDLLSWTDKDAYRIENIRIACQTKLQGALDAELSTTIGPLDSTSWSGALKYPPNHPDSRLWYGPALRALYADVIAEMQIDVYRMSESLDGGDTVLAKEGYGDRRARLASAPRNQFVGEWFGTISCHDSPTPSNSAERLVRLLVDSSAPAPWAELQLGPYKDAYTGSVGGLAMSVDYNPQTRSVSLRKVESTARSQRPPASKSIEGKFQPSTGMLTGTATGLTDLSQGGCTDLTLKKVERLAAPKNPDGLLFQYVVNQYGGIGPHRLTPQHCLDFFSWQSEYESYNLGSRTLYAGLLDDGRMREVFGKDIYQWDVSDAERMQVLRQTCRNVLLQDNNPDRLAVMNRIDPDTWYGWAVLETWPRRVSESGRIEVSADWFRSEQLMRDIAAETKLLKAE